MLQKDQYNNYIYITLAQLSVDGLKEEKKEGEGRGLYTGGRRQLGPVFKKLH